MSLPLSSKPLSWAINSSPGELADPRRILLTHFGKTSDVVRSLPVLVALRHRFPYAEIVWLIGEHSVPLLLDHWAVSRFIVVSHDWFKHISEIRRVRRRLQSFAPQVAVDTQNSFGSSLAAWLSGARFRIGLGGKQKRYLHNIRIITGETNRVERNLCLLQSFGIYGCSVGFDMPECEKNRLAAQNILHRKGLNGNFALLYVSAEDPSERWREERFGMVANYLLEQWNLPSLMIWSDNETESIRAETAVIASCGAAQHAPWTTLSERKALAKMATVFVGSDTAELQIAGAVGAKCVGLFATSSAWENAPLGQEHSMIQSPHRLHRRWCKQSSQQDVMDAITPEMVCEKCDEVLSEILQPGVLPIQQAPSVQKKAA